MSDSHFVGGYTAVIKVGNRAPYYLKPLSKTPEEAVKEANSVVRSIRQYEKATGEKRNKIRIQIHELGEDWKLHRVWGARRKRHTLKRRTSRR